MISGNELFIADSAAQVASTAGVWTQVIAPASNTAGIYVSHLYSSQATDPAANWRAHTSTPASPADGVELGKVGGWVSAGTPYRCDVGVIIPAGQGIYVSSHAASTIFYRVL